MAPHHEMIDNKVFAFEQYIIFIIFYSSVLNPDYSGFIEVYKHVPKIVFCVDSSICSGGRIYDK